MFNVVMPIRAMVSRPMQLTPATCQFRVYQAMKSRPPVR